jgi:hypothetical protein
MEYDSTAYDFKVPIKMYYIFGKDMCSVQEMIFEKMYSCSLRILLLIHAI